MFFIGFFTSPIPYLLLFGIYMSGYAFISIKADACERPADTGEQAIVCSDVGSLTDFHDQTAQWPFSEKVTRQDQLVFYEQHNLPAAYSPPENEFLFFNSLSLSVRPPPVL